MDKYRLKEDFAGLKAGDIITFKTNIYNWSYKGVDVYLKNVSEILEKVEEEPLFYTNEDEVYLDGKKEAFYRHDDRRYYYIFHYSNNISTGNMNRNLISINNEIEKRFLTQKAAQDYIKLQKAIKDSGLKIGDRTISYNLTKYTCSRWKDKKWSETISSYEIEGFCIYNNIPCAYYNTQLCDKAVFFFRLDQFNKPKLLFGDKEVVLKHEGMSISINCAGESISYIKALSFRNAIGVINNFKFGTKSINLNSLGNKFTIGCTTGTLDQIDIILTECEKLLNR